MKIGAIFPAIMLSAGLSFNAVAVEGHNSGAHAHATGDGGRAVAERSAFFDQLKDVMTGNWDGRYTNGTFAAPTNWEPVRVEYRPTSRGSALVEDYFFGDDSVASMTTVYHQDNNDLRLTHYCGASNHPRMVAREVDADAQTALFDFTDITNLDAPDSYHSRQMALTIVSDNHIQIEYHGLQGGMIYSQAYDLRRVETASD